ncbi:dihydrodipicolinate reductase [Roseovarius sp. SCSIO 43702]|uniref:dihydrodipicolinate reductase n=1 Tax=Roseovarius sp. SCSIO 43702 TaxID=2823043 RepID=UPI001C738C3C|nr:dihydrodipicolinate reductase [Roseovarius sp. SCSIO 43702]QYX57050.1 dihydrodipicolinate reductase [Roseovarius sp. SCSIO 43702]
MRIVLAIVTALGFTSPVFAENFTKINDKARFVSLIQGRNLTRFGINLVVTPGGDIRGRAFGRDVSGDWMWKSGYFCRDLYWGGKDLGANCQAVAVQGNTLRFISDRGKGEFADLVLK